MARQFFRIVLGGMAFLLATISAASLASAAGPAEPPAASKGDVAAFSAMLEGFDRNAAKAQAALADRAGDLDPDRRMGLNQLRAQLARDRDKADALAATGSLDLRIIRAQIAALGAPPAEGASEPASVSAQRKLLDAKLGRTMAPILRLRDAQARASVLVAELDSMQQAAAKARLFAHDVTPLDPRQWARAADEVAKTARRASANMKTFGKRASGATIAGAEIVALLLFALGPALGWLVWSWLARRIDRRREQAVSVARSLGLTLLLDATATLVFVIALALGIGAMMLALMPFASPRVLGHLVSALAGACVLVAAGRWLGRSVLLSPFAKLRLVELSQKQAAVANATVLKLTLVLASIAALDSLEEYDLAGSNLSHLLSAALVALGGWLLWRLANSFKAGAKDNPEGSFDGAEPADHRIDFATPLSRLLKLFAVASIVAALVGFAMLARYIFASTLLSLALVGIAVYLHRSIDLVIEMVSAGHLRRYRRALHFVPLVAGFVLTLVAVPLLAMIWGYSGAEIADGILLLRNGVDFGEVRISLGDVLTFAAVFFIGYFITRWLQRFLKVTVLPEFAMDQGAEAALLTFLGYLGITLAALVAIATTGLDLSNLAFIAGALSVGLGFGLQSVVENFTSGVLLLIERPIKVGDWIEVGENSGIVRKIAVRSTHIETFDRHQIIIPNSQLIAGVVKNRSFTTGPARIVVPVGVAYGSDLDRVSAIMLEIAQGTEGVLDFPEPAVAMDGFGDSAINLKILAFVAAATDGAPTASRINFAIARRFAEEGIEIPFPQRDLHLRTVPEGWPQVI